MFKVLFFAALVAFVSAKPGLVAPLAYSAPLVSAPVISAYNTPVVSAYSGYPGVAAYSAHPAAYSAHPAAYSAYPAVSAYSAYPGVSAYSAYPAVSAYSAGVPLAYSGVKYY